MALRDLWTRLRGGETPQASDPAPQGSEPGPPPPPVVEPPAPEPPGERPPETPPPSTPEPIHDPTPDEAPPDISDPLAPDSPGVPIEEPRMEEAKLGLLARLKSGLASEPSAPVASEPLPPRPGRLIHSPGGGSASSWQFAAVSRENIAAKCQLAGNQQPAPTPGAG